MISRVRVDIPQKAGGTWTVSIGDIIEIKANGILWWKDPIGCGLERTTAVETTLTTKELLDILEDDFNNNDEQC